MPVIRRGARSPLSLENDRGKPASVNPFATQTGTPITEKLRLFGDGVVTNDVNRCHPGPSETVGDVTPQIEQKMAFARRRHEIVGVVGAACEEGLRKLWPNLVGTLGNAWTDCGTDAVVLGAEHRHPREHRLGNASESAAPPAMRRADNLGNGVVKEDRRTICRQHAQCNSRNRRDQPICARRLLSAINRAKEKKGKTQTVDVLRREIGLDSKG